MLNLPGVYQLRVLHDQKYPKDAPQSFRVPYYQPAMTGIRSYYRSGGSSEALESARVGAASLRPPTKRDQNLRVISQFELSRQAKRQLVPLPMERHSHTVSGVDLRLRFDLIASEEGATKYILYNFKNVTVDSEMARTTLEIAYWLMQQVGSVVPVKSLELVEISTGAFHSISSVRRTTLRHVEANARLIQALWPTV